MVHMIVASIEDGISRGVGHCSVVFRPIDDSNSEIEYDTLYVDWSNSSGPEIAELDFIVAGIAQLMDEVFIVGRLGCTVKISNGIFSREMIQGPDRYGFLTDIKVIDGSTFAVGMSRQVYLKNEQDNWSRFDAGVIDDTTDVDRVTGFRAIDGLSTGDMYAVGLDGEIWNYRVDAWKRIESPTNVTLEQVKMVSSDGVYAAGQAGVILHGSGDRWDFIDQSLTEDDFWGVEWFNNSLYLTTATNIYRLNTDHELELVTPANDGPSHFACLSASQGALWSFAGDKAFWTIDGVTWEEAGIFSSGDTNN